MQFLICVNMSPTDSINIIMQCYHACLHELQHWNVKTKPTLKKLSNLIKYKIALSNLMHSIGSNLHIHCCLQIH